MILTLASMGSDLDTEIWKKKKKKKKKKKSGAVE